MDMHLQVCRGPWMHVAVSGLNRHFGSLDSMEPSPRFKQKTVKKMTLSGSTGFIEVGLVSRTL
jgi:hypothetical protein